MFLIYIVNKNCETGSRKINVKKNTEFCEIFISLNLHSKFTIFPYASLSRVTDNIVKHFSLING